MTYALMTCDMVANALLMHKIMRDLFFNVSNTQYYAIVLYVVLKKTKSKPNLVSTP